MSGYLTSDGTDLSSIFMDKQLNKTTTGVIVSRTLSITSGNLNTITTTGINLSKGTYLIYIQVYCSPSGSGAIKYAIICLSSTTPTNLLTSYTGSINNGIIVFSLGSYTYNGGSYVFINETQLMNVPTEGTYNLYLQVVHTITLSLASYIVNYIKISD